MKLFDVYFTKGDGSRCRARYCCTDKSEARRLFFSEVKKGEKLVRVAEARDKKEEDS